MEIVDEMNERFELCPIERSGANTIINETFKKFRKRAGILCENLFFDKSYKKIGIIWSHFGAHGNTVNLLEEFVAERKTVEI